MPSAFRRKTAPIKTGDSNGQNNNSSSIVPTATTSFATLSGVKPWQGGLYLTSSGLQDLDVVIGGGQPIGTCLLVQEDRFSTALAQTLVQYWCAEAISQQQVLLAPIVVLGTNVVSGKKEEDVLHFDDDHGNGGSSSFELQTLLENLPRNLHWDKWKQRSEVQQAQETTSSLSLKDTTTMRSHLEQGSGGMMEILEEEEDDGEEDDESMDSGSAAATALPTSSDDNLRNAWQYKASVQQHRSGVVPGSSSSASSTSQLTKNTVYCHSYDLSRRMAGQDDAGDLDASSWIVNITATTTTTDEKCASRCHRQRGMELFRRLVKCIRDKLKEESARHAKAVRLLLFHPASLPEMTVALPLLLAYIRNESLPVVVLLCIPSTTDVSSWISLSRTSDIVLSTEGFASRREYPPPAEFRHLHGILKIHKTTKKWTEVAAWIYGFKRDRRKLHIQLLHIPPEDYADNGGSVSAGGVRSGAGRPQPNSNSSNSNFSASKRSGTGMGCSSNLSGSPLDF